MSLSFTLRCAFVVLAIGLGPSAHACMCANRGATLPERITKAVAVNQTAFLGRATARSTVVGHTAFTRAAGMEKGELEQIRFSVIRVWSGSDNKQITVRFDQSTSCDVAVSLGRYYLVLAFGEIDGLESNRCGIFELTESEARTLLRDKSFNSQNAPPNQPLHHDASGGLTAAGGAGERRR